MRTFSTLYKQLTGVFPEVKAKNASSQFNTDGTDISAINIDDILWGWIQALLNFVGQTPNGVPETYNASQIFDAMKEAFNQTHADSDGKSHSDVVLNNTHRISDGTDHSFIDQDLKSIASPTFAGIKTDNVVLKTKVIEIGDWNMVANATKLVAHGLIDNTKVRSVSAIIRNDISGTSILNLNGMFVEGIVDGGINETFTTSIDLRRSDAGVFNSLSFDSTSYNRGWITITYEA